MRNFNEFMQSAKNFAKDKKGKIFALLALLLILVLTFNSSNSLLYGTNKIKNYSPDNVAAVSTNYQNPNASISGRTDSSNAALNTLIAQNENDNSIKKGIIHVTGVGKRDVVPDKAVIYFTVSVIDKDLNTSNTNAVKTANKFVSEVAKIVGNNNVMTFGFNTYPEYEYNEVITPIEPQIPEEKGTAVRKTEKVFVGYRTMISVSVKADIDDVGKIINLAINNKIDNINGINYEISNLDKIKMDLLKEAMKNARAKAEAVLSAENAKVGKISYVIVQEDYYSGFIYKSLSDTAATGQELLNIHPGVQTISVTVAVDYEIEQ